MTIEKVLRYVAIGCLFLVPFIVLYVSSSLFFPYITGKNFAFRILVEIAAAAWFSLALIDSRYRPKRSWITLCFALFVGIMAIADIFGLNPTRSFWSNFERMEGWVTLAHLLLYLVVLVSLLTTEKLWQRFWQMNLAVSAVVGLNGILQLFGFLAISQQSGMRLDATFGNATYLGGYMLFNVFVAALLWLQDYAERRKVFTLPGALYCALIVLDSLVLFFTATRGAILGSVVGALVVGVLFFINAPRSKLARITATGAIAVIVLLFGFWFLKDTTFVQKIEPLRRLSTISLSETTVAARFLNYKMAWSGFLERPILGWGQDNYGLVFDKYYDPNMYAQEPWFDRVHNIVFDWLVAGGILGFLGYFSVVLALLLALWRRNVFSPEERAVLTGLVSAYMIHNLFVFDNIASYCLYMCLLAYVAHRSSTSSEPLFGNSVMSARMLPGLAVLSVVLAWGLAWGVNANALAQNRVLLNALKPQSSGILTNLEYFNKAISYGGVGRQEAREQLTQGVLRLASANVPQDVKQKFFDAAVKELQLQAQAVPREARFPLFLGTILQTYGDNANADIALKRALELSPKKQTILFQLGSNANARGDNVASVQWFKQAFDLAPAYNDARTFYAAALIRAGNTALAQEILKPLVDAGESPNQYVIGAYIATGHYDDVANLWRIYIEKHPEDLQGRYTLAAVYFAEHMPAKSIMVLEQAKKDFPSAGSQIDNLITKIQNGTAVLE